MADTSNHVLGDETRGCGQCGEPTRWIELSFEVPLCPGPCSDASWAEYADVERRAGPIRLPGWAR